MKKNLTTYIYVFLAVILTSCTDHTTLDRLDYIKEIGNENPEKALVMLDSVEVDIKRASAYAKTSLTCCASDSMIRPTTSPCQT